MSPASLKCAWRKHRLYLHRVSTFKVSTDPHFLEKLTDVVGIYMNPPDNAAVLCIDEKTMIQALARTQPGLPIKRGKAGTVTQRYHWSLRGAQSPRPVKWSAGAAHGIVTRNF